MGEPVDVLEPGEALARALRDPFCDPTPYFAAALVAERGETREQTAALIRRYPSAALVPVLLGRLEHEEDTHVQAEIIETLGFLRVESAIPAILPFAGSTHELTRANVAEALGIIAVRGPAITQTLLHLLSDEVAVVRCYAAEALGDIGDSARALEALRSRQERDRSWLVRVWCVYGRARLGDPIDWETLRQAFAKSERMVRKQTLIVLRHLVDDTILIPTADLLREAQRTETDDALADEMTAMLRVVENAATYP